jgi:hypothetical protein
MRFAPIAAFAAVLAIAVPGHAGPIQSYSTSALAQAKASGLTSLSAQASESDNDCNDLRWLERKLQLLARHEQANVKQSWLV